jgi:predicted ribosomally synthesized peptide with nif11-like leader
MSIAEIERFAADLKTNEALRAEAARPTQMNGAVAFAAANGYDFTADELKEHARARSKAAGKELTDAELDGATGGNGNPFAGFWGTLFGGGI